MLSKGAILSAGLMATNSVEAFSFQEFIPDRVSHIIDDASKIDFSHLANVTKHVNPAKIAKIIAGKKVVTPTPSIKKKINEVSVPVDDTNIAETQSWQEGQQVDKTDPDYSKNFE